MTPNQRMKKISEELQKKRSELANDLGMSRSAISMILTGKNPVTKPVALAIQAVYGYQAKWILTGEGESYEAENQNRRIRDRLRLIKQDLGITQGKLARSVGMSPSGFASMMTKPERKFSESLALAIQAVHGYRAEWILTGEGPRWLVNDEDDFYSIDWGSIGRKLSEAYRELILQLPESVQQTEFLWLAENVFNSREGKDETGENQEMQGMRD